MGTALHPELQKVVDEMHAVQNQKWVGLDDDVPMPPHIQGKHARAWRVDMEALQAERELKGLGEGPVGVWVVEAPWAHLAWHSYLLSVVHLRHQPGQPDIQFYIEGATHEITVHALDPNHPRSQTIFARSFPMLNPTNFAAQFIAENDAEAYKRVEQDVDAICAGQLSPDTDFTAMWIARYNDAMVRQ